MKKILEILRANITSLRYGALFVLFVWFLVSRVQVVPGTLQTLLLALGLVLAVADLCLEARTLAGFLKGRRAKGGLRISLTLFLLAGILAMLYYLFVRQVPLRADLTSNERYSLSEQTLLALKNLDEPVKFYIFRMEPPKNARPDVAGWIGMMQQHVAALEFVLQDYNRKNSRVSYEIVDMEEEPGLVKEYGVQQPFTIVATAGRKTRQIRSDEYVVRQVVGQRLRDVPQYEEALTAALGALVRQKTWNIVFTSGHGEKDPFDEGQGGALLLREALEKEGFTVTATNLVMARGVPEKTDLLVIAGPRDDFAAREVADVEAHLVRGGAAFFLGERDAGPNYRALVSRWGVDFGQEAIFDPGRHLGQGVIMPDVVPHRITKGLAESKRNVFLALATPLAKSAAAAGRADAKSGARFAAYSMSELLRSTPGAWAETDKDVAEKGAGEQEGPFAAAWAVTVAPKKVETKDGKETVTTAGPDRELNIAIFGDADFIANAYLGQFPGNRDFFVNAANWAIGQEDRIAISPKTMKSYPLNLTEGEANFLKYFSLVVMPLIVIVTGIVVYVRRKKYGAA